MRGKWWRKGMQTVVYDHPIFGKRFQTVQKSFQEVKKILQAERKSGK